MCSVSLGLTVASFAAGAAQSVAQYQAQRTNYERQVEFQNAQAEFRAERAKQANKNFAHQEALLDLREDQEEEAAFQRRFETRLQSLRDQATARVARSEAGAAGLSVDALLADFAATEGRAQRAIDVNLENAFQDIQSQRESLFANAMSIYNQTKRPIRRPTPPSPLSAGLGIASAGVSAYSDYRTNEAIKNNVG